ncbi:hypothetical protein NC653_020741 [Populus alba x Populus x berolinensis]|uniref:Uncharacterized protein n=1 Tax=Populus alba x Populus x berolinensis TaxID=444605 RepID=A0AAD6ML61_9ROSI|nr:hypothetical protein NC653_020741 [Populus alba x Populus x berolinensis]
MYSPRGSNAYGAQSDYAQYLGMTYSGSSVGGHDGGSQHSLASRHSSILGGPQEADVGGFRDMLQPHHIMKEGQYRAVYGSASMSGAQQSDMKAEKDYSEDQPKNTSDTISPRSKLGVPNSSEMRDLKEDKKHENESDQKSSSGTKTEVKADKQKVALKDNANSKGGKLKITRTKVDKMSPGTNQIRSKGKEEA